MWHGRSHVRAYTLRLITGLAGRTGRPVQDRQGFRGGGAGWRFWVLESVAIAALTLRAKTTLCGLVKRVNVFRLGGRTRAHTHIAYVHRAMPREIEVLAVDDCVMGGCVCSI